MGDFEVRTDIDLHDVQGNIIKGYGRYGFPVARYVMFRVNSERAGRAFIGRVLPMVTTSAPWTTYGNVEQGTTKPKATTNIAFTHSGLRRMALPEKALLSFPQDFAMGMRGRTAILGDDHASSPAHWDPIWKSDDPQTVHILITINAETPDHRERRYEEILAAVEQANVRDPDGVVQLTGHRDAHGDAAAFQDANALTDDDGRPIPKEHFGYDDGIGDPYFVDSGSYPTHVAGGGKRVRGPAADRLTGWKPIETGEFLLGHVDEADEYPVAPIPSRLAKNGTYLVYRKLHQNVATFDRYLDEQAYSVGDSELLAAKLVGRWRNGAPLTTFGTHTEADAFVAELDEANRARRSEDTSVAGPAKERYYTLKQRLMAFDYGDDIDGSRCPVGAHMRRMNPRGSLEFGVDKAYDRPGALVDRRRIVRRGLPYGNSDDRSSNDGDHGVIFMAIGASISRQFEFVQQQWANYGNDFKLANDRDPIIGNQPPAGGNMTIQAPPGGDHPPVFCRGIPRFVETRGGDYFFVPSLTALADIAAGTVDPT